MATFTASTVTMDGVTCPITWTQPRGGYTDSMTIYATVTLPDGSAAEITIAPEHPDHGAAVNAADAARAAAAAARRAAAAAKAADPAYQAHGAVPAKTWTGTRFIGFAHRWTVSCYDDAIIVEFPGKGRPAAALLDAVKAAGFAYSPTTYTWRKKGTWKAYRAALALVLQLAAASDGNTSLNTYGNHIAPAAIESMLQAAKNHAAA